MTLYAQWTLNTYQLSVVAGTGGTITAPPASPVTVNHGAATTITAMANAGYTFSGWVVGPGTGSIANAASASTTITLTAGDATVTANFTLNTYQLSVVAGTGGTITAPPTSPVTVNHGAATTITALADAGYTFSGWVVGPGTGSIANAANASTTITLTAGDATVTANFTINTYTLTYTAGANGTIMGMSPQTVNHGANGTPVTAVADSGYHFVNWSPDNSTQNPRTDTNVMANVNVTANFALNPTTSFSIDDVTQNEGNSGDTSFVFTVTKTGPDAASVSFTTQDGTALAGSDYTANSGTLNFDAGDATMQITVLVTGDTTPEPTETFTVELSGASAGTSITDASGLGTITNDDGQPSTVYRGR